MFLIFKEKLTLTSMGFLALNNMEGAAKETPVINLNQLSPSYETFHECGTISDLSKNTKIVIKVTLLF